MSRMKTVLGLTLGVLLTAGCYKHSYTVGSGGDTNAEPQYSQWESHWFLGIIGESHVDVKEVCPSGNATLKDQITFLNGLVGSLIGIVWYPSTVEVYCGAGGSATVQLSPEQMRKIALDPGALKFARSISLLKEAELESAIEAYGEANRNVASREAPSQL